MHGYGYPPQQPARRPSPAALIALRVVFVALALLSFGFLSWAALLRLALVTRKGRDWALLALVVVCNTAMFVHIVTTPDNQEELTDAQALTFLGWLVCTVAGTVTYYLYTDIRHFGRPGGSGGHAPYTGYVPPRAPAAGIPAPTPGYGYPPSPPVPARTPAPPPPPTAPPSPTPRPATPQRIDQVRAELDELSDYLRKEGDSR
ncbi:hypothetical protein AB0G71_06860 [Streptomyces sp. NPDC020403]|uniref:hypothetical protein n=1 Tax=unclassified Streptomyces TaxID=2593676 RepID=UPI0033C61BD8